jgi:hypothetical protein
MDIKFFPIIWVVNFSSGALTFRPSDNRQYTTCVSFKFNLPNYVFYFYFIH